ncbi:MAG: hypothetical protein K6U74_06990 [Firmicutes bacterium]|nr:hypothetical protein [Bacillota bacterium]
MAHLDTGPQRKEYPPRVIYEFLQMIEEAINHLDKNNFPYKVSGDDILSDYSTSLKKLYFMEFIVFTVSAVPIYTTTSTAGVNIGPYFAWDPAKFPGGNWYIEGSIAVANAAATATLTLKGEADVGSVQTADTTLKRIRSAGPLTMPATAQNLWFNLKTNNASYAAQFAGAHLIYVP